jgi:anti-sigma factor RsiW
MKPRCQELEALFAPYVDEEAAPTERAAIDAHLTKCPPCRNRIAGERAARDVVRARRTGLRPCASEALRMRCAAQRSIPAARGGLLTRRTLVPLSLAAALLVGVSATLFFAGNTVEVMAAQLAVDHVKCFQFAPDRAAARPDPLAEGVRWESSYGWPLKVPASAEAEQLELVSVRRCLSSEGRIAHLMYLWRGEPLSVFVLNRRLRSRSGTPVKDDPQAMDVKASIERFGEHAVIWSRGDRTYAVVARDSGPGLQQVAQYVRRASE